MAIGDFDNDGAVDVLVAVNNDAPVLLRNTATAGKHWLGIQLVGKKANRDAIGASVTWKAGDLKRHRLKVGGGSYLASHDPRMVLGIGTRTKVDWLEVKWPKPSDVVERFTSCRLTAMSLSLREKEQKWKRVQGNIVKHHFCKPGVSTLRGTSALSIRASECTNQMLCATLKWAACSK